MQIYRIYKLQYAVSTVVRFNIKPNFSEAGIQTPEPLGPRDDRTRILENRNISD